MAKLVAFAVLLVSLTATAHAVNNIAKAYIAPTAVGGGGSGSVTIVDNGSGTLTFTYALSGFTAFTTYSTHIHINGDVSGLNTEGGHFNPGNLPHGCAPNLNRHAGDLGNLTSDGSGNISADIVTTLPSLDSNSLYFIVGRAIVIHALPDTCGQPTGAAGARIANGVIGWGQLATYTTPDEKGILPAGSRYSAVLVGTTSYGTGVSGSASFVANADGTVTVSLDITGLAASTNHGIHIHANGDVSDRAAGTAAGGHFNPDTVSHGCPGINATYHTGDLGVFQSDANGNITASFARNTKLRLASNSLNSILGRGLVVHAMVDDCYSQPTGNSGNRVAEGVIGTNTAVVYSTTPAPTNAPPTSTPTTTTAPSAASSLTASVVALVAAIVAVLAVLF